MAQLNQQQKKAVEHHSGPLLILAGAGSGKTRVITFRNLYLLKRGVNYRNILNLTFTQKAAQEMKKRTKSLCSELLPKGKTISTTTFHSFGLRLIKKNLSLSKYLKNISIIDSSEQKEIISNLLKEKKSNFDSKVINDIILAISKAKNNLREEITTPNSYDVNYSAIYEKYQKFTFSHNLLDFDDILLVCYNLLKNNPPLRLRLQNFYEFIMVDEFQDTNLLQLEILKLLLNKNKNLTVVGDDDQAIYSWRGANLNNILEFEKIFPNTKIITLEENYRSTNSIVQLANKFIKNNQERKTKNLYSKLTSSKKTSINELLNDYEEAKFVAESIMFKKFKHNLSFSNSVILYRTKNQSKVIERVLLEKKLPFKVWGKKGFFEYKEIKDLLAFGKLLTNPNNSMAFLRVINLSAERRLKEKTISFLKENILDSELTLTEILANDNFMSNIDLKEKKNLDFFFKVINVYKEQKGDLFVSFTDFLREIEYFDYLQLNKEEPEIKKIKQLRVENFLKIIQEYEKKRKNRTFKDFFLQLMLNLSEQVQEEDLRDEVNLMTIHAAKGLEFNYVYIVGLEEGTLPNFHEETGTTNTNEERRLFYVALTRAKKECFISYSQEKKIRGKAIRKEPSSFLEELPKSLIIHNSQSKANFSVDLQEEGNTTEIKEKGFERLKELLKK